jgi:hypothetical protein
MMIRSEGGDPVPVGSEQDRDIRRDDQRIVEEIRRLFERYRETARHASEPVQQDQQLESPDRTRALTLR